MSSARTLTSLQRGRHVAGQDAVHEAFDDGGFADAGLAGEDGVVLAAAHEDVHALADFLVASDDRVNLAFARFFGEVGGEPFEGLLFAHLGGRDGAAGFARRGARAQAGAVAGAQGVFGRAGDDFGEIVGELFGLDFGELAGEAEEHVAERIGLEKGDDEVAGADLGFAKEKRGIKPGLLERRLDVRRKVADGRGAARQTVERGDQVGGEARACRG